MTRIILIISILSVFSAAFLLAALYWYSFVFEPVNFRLSRLDINIKRKENGTNPERKKLFTILHLSDFHLRNDRVGKKMKDFLTSLHKLEPDFILITGDLVEKNENFYLLDDVLAGFKASIGKYAVLGVHDYFNKSPREFLKNMVKRKKAYSRQNDVEKLISILENYGIKTLRNESRQIKINNPGRDGLLISIAGIEDPIIQKSDVLKTFNGSKAPRHEDRCAEYNELFQQKRIKEHILNEPGRIVICLTHTPDRKLFRELSCHGADLVFCGHTHGGQIRIPGIGAVISGCDLKARYASGLFYFKKFALYISRGLGEGRYSPFRFFCQPEATFLTVNLVE